MVSEQPESESAGPIEAPVVETPEAAAAKTPPAPKIPRGYEARGPMKATFESAALPSLGRLTLAEPRWGDYMAFQDASEGRESTVAVMALFLRACVHHTTTGALKPRMSLAELTTFVEALTLTEGNALASAAAAFRDQMVRARIAAGNG